MYTLGIPHRQYRRTTQVLGPELSTPISYNTIKQDDGFYMFSFPEVDEYEFKDIVMLLKNNGITTIGADNTLTERNIMKLTDLLKEQGNPDENNLLDILKRTLESWEKPDYKGGIEDCPKSDHYFEDIKDIIEDYEEDLGGDAIAMGADDARDMMNEAKGYNQKYDTPFPLRGTDAEPKSQTIKKVINLKMDSEVGEPVTVEYDPKKNLTDVTISWGNESHTVDFEAGDVIDDHGNEGADIETMAESDDGRWQFILDVYVGYQFKNTGDYEEWDFEELIVQGHPDNEDHLEPEDRSDDGDFDDDGEAFANAKDDIDTMEEGKFLREQLQKRAGIIK